jgi:uncharacterized protein
VQEAEAFYRRFWNLMMADGNRLWVREFHSMFGEILSRNPNRTRSLVEPFIHLNVDWQGNVSTFSPELLPQTSERFGNFVFGNLRHDELSAVAESPRLAELQREIDEGVDRCRDECAYFALCGGGAPSNKLAEHGTFAATETMYCRVNVKVLADIVLEIIEAMAAEGAPLPQHQAGEGAQTLPATF